MNDLTYTAAREAAGERGAIRLGPAPCMRCGAWVEWAGVAWLALGTDEPHECWPYLGGGVPEPEIVAEWTRPTTGLPAYRGAHPMPPELPAWVLRLGTVLLALALGLTAALAGAALARWLA